jgi:hypothetical protein
MRRCPRWKASARPVRASPVSANAKPVLCQAERASLAAQSRRIETEAAPIRYVAELIGVDTDNERAIRWLIALNGVVLRPAGDRADGCGLRPGGNLNLAPRWPIVRRRSYFRTDAAAPDRAGSAMNDQDRLRAVALQIVATLPADQDEALRILAQVCDVIRWRHRAAVAPKPTLTVIEGGAQ